MDEPSADAPSPGQVATYNRRLVFSLVVGGIVTLALALAIGLSFGAAFFALGLVSIVDFTLAWLFATERIGYAAQRRQERQLSPTDRAIVDESVEEALAEEEPDRSYNPYARED